MSCVPACRQAGLPVPPPRRNLQFYLITYVLSMKLEADRLKQESTLFTLQSGLVNGFYLAVTLIPEKKSLIPHFEKQRKKQV